MPAKHRRSQGWSRSITTSSPRRDEERASDEANAELAEAGKEGKFLKNHIDFILSFFYRPLPACPARATTLYHAARPRACRTAAQPPRAARPPACRTAARPPACRTAPRRSLRPSGGTASRGCSTALVARPTPLVARRSPLLARPTPLVASPSSLATLSLYSARPSSRPRSR